MRERSYIHVYPRILNKDGELHDTPWFAVAESPSKIPTYETSTYQNGSSLIDARLFYPNLFLQSFTVRTLLLSENKEKNMFHGFENSTGRFLPPRQFWPAFVAVSECTSVSIYCPATAKLQPSFASSTLGKASQCLAEVISTPSIPTTVLATTRRDSFIINFYYCEALCMYSISLRCIELKTIPVLTVM